MINYGNDERVISVKYHIMYYQHAEWNRALHSLKWNVVLYVPTEYINYSFDGSTLSLEIF